MGGNVVREVDVISNKVEIIFTNYLYEHYEVMCGGKKTGRGYTIQEAIKDFDNLNKILE